MVSESLKMEKKRIRTENWLEEDKLLLKELVRERVQAIENKNTDTNTNKKKKEAWADLHSTFNAMCIGVKRSVAQLKTQWSVTKVAAKKEKALYRREAFKTGGGPCPKEPDNQATDISVWLPFEFTTDSNQFDSDEIPATSSSTVTTQLEPLKNPEDIIPSTISVDVKEVLPLLPQPIEDQQMHLPVLLSDSNSNVQNQNEGKKLKIIKKKTKKQQTKPTAETTGAAAKIVESENNCRQELHELQMENERKRARNLDLKYELLLAKLNNEKSKDHHQ